MHRLFLVRHGITEWNQNGLYQGQIDIPLSSKGRMQLAALGQRLREEQFAVCYTSLLERARVSAQLVLEWHFCPVRETAQLNELSYGAWEGLNRAQIAERFPEDWERFRADPVEQAPTNGESHAALQRRVAEILADIGAEHDGSAVLVVAHGGTIRAAVAHYLQLDPREVWRMRLDNGSLTIIDVYDGSGVLTLFNDTAHLGAGKAPLDLVPLH